MADAAEGAPGAAETAPEQATDGTAPAEAKEPPRRFRVKVDDAEMEVDEAELIKGYSRAKAAHRRFEEASSMRKEVEGFLTALKQNPIAVLQDPSLGLDFRKIAEDYLYDQIKREEMSPEQRKIQEYERKLAEMQAERERFERESTEQKITEEQHAYAQKIEAEFTEALESSGLPKTTETVRRMAYLKRRALDAGYDMPATDLVVEVRESYLEEQRSVLGGLEGDALLSAIDEDILYKIRAAELARLRRGTETASEGKAASKGAPSGKKKPESLEDAIASFLD